MLVFVSIQHRDCGMTFQSQNQLSNHKKKFCLNSKYGQLQQLQKNFQTVSNNRDISKFGKMSLAKQGRTYDFQKNQQNTNKLDEEYRQILKLIQDQKNIKNKLQLEKQKAFRELQALEKQQEQIIIDDKRNNLQDIIAKRQTLARQQEQLQRQIKQYQMKKKQWNQSQIRNKEVVDQPYQQGIKAGKLTFQRAMLQERKHNMQLQLNAKRRQKQKIQRNILEMSAVQEVKPVSKASIAGPPIKSPLRSNPAVKFSEPPSHKTSQAKPRQIDYSRLNQQRPQRPRTQISQASQSSKHSSYLSPNTLDGTQKILKFNLNHQGKSQQDKLIQSIMAQQYDDLLILSKLPKGSQLYNMKMKQYTQLSKYRMQVQQKAQKQRINKMKKQFEFQKILNQKQKINNQWVDQNRKAFMEKQVQIIKNGQNNQNNMGSYPQTNPSIQLPGTQAKMNKNRNIPSGIQLPNGQYRPPIALNMPNLNTNPNIQAYPYNANNKNNNNIKKDPFGYRISILFLRNYSLKRAIKIKLIIYQEYYHQKDMGMKHEFATIYHQQSAEKDPFNAHIKNKLDQTGAIAYNQSFYITQNLQQLYNKNQKQIYLLIIAAQKDQKRITNQPKPYCWYSFKITHFGQIKQGRFTVNLYGDDILYPYPADMNKMKKKKQQQITLQLQQVLLDKQILQSLKTNSPNLPSNQSINNINNSNPSNPSISKLSNNTINPNKTTIAQIPSQNSKNGVENMSQTGSVKDNKDGKISMNYPIKLKNIDEGQAINNINQQYFYSNQKATQFSHVQLKKPLNFDVSVSGLRTLPSYIGPVKLQISFLDADSSNVLPKQQFLAEISTDLYNPLVSYTRKIRNQSKIPPSTIIFIRMIAISAMDYQVYSLGFTLIYLFLNKQGQPIKTNKIKDYLMTSGYYQLPIFWGNIQPQYIDIQDLLTKYPPIPCASILIGILQNASKISNPMPLYSQKVYNTILFQIDDNQAKLFEHQYRREPIDTNTLISGYLQYKGIKKNYSGQQITKYLFKTLTFSTQNTKQKLQLKWMAEYQEQFGINFVIDKLYVPEQELLYYYFITVCISPPANYYKKKNFDLNFCRKVNFNTSTTTQFMFEDNQFFINPAYFKNSSLIIQINRIQIFQSVNTQADNNIQGFAYIVIPLFQIQEQIRAVNVMQANLSLFQGDFDSNYIQKLEKNLPAFLEKNQKNKKSKAQISFRVLNGYFMNQFQPVGPKKSTKTKMYKDIPPQNMSFQDVLEDIVSILSSNYNLQIS